MRQIEPFEHDSVHQPFPDDPVSFKLKPLDMRGFYEVQASLVGRDTPSWSGIEMASRYIVGWKGEGLGRFSQARVRQIVGGQFDVNWTAWLGEIAAALYRHALLSEADKKKS